MLSHPLLEISGNSNRIFPQMEITDVSIDYENIHAKYVVALFPAELGTYLNSLINYPSFSLGSL